MDRIRFEFCLHKGDTTEVIMYRAGSRYTRVMSNDDARWMVLAIESGKQLAKEKIKNVLGR